MSGQEAASSGQEGGMPQGQAGGGHLHHRSWGSDDWQGLLSAHFGGVEELVQPQDASSLLRPTSDGAMLHELLRTLEAGDDGCGLDLSAPIFSERTINAIMGEQMREMAAQTLREQQQQQQAPPIQDPMKCFAAQAQASSTLMNLQEATAALQAAHLDAADPPAAVSFQAATAVFNPQPSLQHSALAGTKVALPAGVQIAHAHAQQQQQQSQPQQFVTLLDGRILQKQDGTAVLANLPAGQQQLSVPITGTGSVLQYVPVLNSRMLPVQLPTGAPQHQAVASVPLPDVSTTQELVAAASVAQQQLMQEATTMQRQPSAPEAAVAAMAEAAAAFAEVSAPLAHVPELTRAALMMPPTLTMATTVEDQQNQQQSSSVLTPQLRLATNAPFPEAFATAVAAVTAPTPAAPQPVPTLRPADPYEALNHPTKPYEAHAPEQQQQQQRDHIHTEEYDCSLPCRPSHKRERSLRSAAPLLADPLTAPMIKQAKGHASELAFGTSPDSPCYGVDGVIFSSSSGDVSPHPIPAASAVAAAASTAANAAAALVLTPITMDMASQVQGSASAHALQMKSNESAETAPEGPSPAIAAAAGGEAGAEALVADAREKSLALAALIDATLAPKPGKRRGRPPGKSRYATAAALAAEAQGGGGGGGAAAPAEPSDGEILERLLQEDSSRRCLAAEELKRLVRREKNKISAAISRARSQVYTHHLEDQVKRLEAEHADLADWLRAPPQVLPHRVMMFAGKSGVAEPSSAPLPPHPPIRHMSL